MRAQFVRGVDPMDSMELGDVRGRKLDKIRSGIYEVNKDPEVINLRKKLLQDRTDQEKKDDYLKAEEIIQGILPNADIDHLGSLPTEEMYIRQEGRTGPYWTIRVYPKHRYISYNWNFPHQSTSKPFYKNVPKSPDYDPYITWQELAIIFLKIISDKKIKLPKHTIW